MRTASELNDLVHRAVEECRDSCSRRAITYTIHRHTIPHSSGYESRDFAEVRAATATLVLATMGAAAARAALGILAGSSAPGLVVEWHDK